MKKKIPMTDVYMNGNKFLINSPTQMLADIFLGVRNINYWSPDALSKLYKGVVEMIVEFGYDGEMIFNYNKDRFENKFLNAQFKNFVLKAPWMLKYCPKDSDGILTKIYEIALIADKKGLLRGYGVTNTFGDALKGDPERQSLKDIESRRVET